MDGKSSTTHIAIVGTYGSMLPFLSIASKVLGMLDRFGGSCIYVDRRSANLVVGQKFETSE